MNFIR
ncbi:hypothetical protein VCHC17A1_3976A, partial [Vibrio cholerae HC-17A1]